MPSSRAYSHPGIKPRSPALQADSLPSEPPGKPSFNQQWLAFGAGCPREGSELPTVEADLLKKEVRRKLWDGQGS